MMVDCCATDDSACTMLKMEFPELSSSDPDMHPDFCAMHGNVCTRRGNALYTFICVCLGPLGTPFAHVHSHTWPRLCAASILHGEKKELIFCRDGYLLELGAFAGGDLSCEFPAASIMKVFTSLRRIDLSGNRISGK